MKIIIHRGAKQIGGTCIEISSKEARLIFDVGEELPDIYNPDKAKSILTVDDLFKDSAITRNKIDGVFISHNHGDHIGLIENVRPEIPIFIGKLAAEIHNTICDFISKDNKIISKIYLEHETSIIIKDIIVTPFLIDHSAYDAYAFLIESNGEKIIYTGDFRRHGAKGKFTEYLAKSPKAHCPDVLLIEGTNLYKNDFVAETENKMGEKAEAFMRKIKGNVFVLQSTTNIDRLEQIYEACRKTNRTLIVDIFTAHILSNIPDKKFNDIKIFYPFWLTQNMFKSVEGSNKMYKFHSRKLPNEELKSLKDLCILVRENMLSDIQKRMNYDDAGLIYSKWEGYKVNKKTNEFVDFFKEKESIHTSGHADVQTIKDFIIELDPIKIIPVHTETPEKYKELFNERTELVDDNIEYELKK